MHSADEKGIYYHNNTRIKDMYKSFFIQICWYAKKNTTTTTTNLIYSVFSLIK